MLNLLYKVRFFKETSVNALKYVIPRCPKVELAVKVGFL